MLQELEGQGLLGPMNARDRGAAGAGGLQKPGRQAPILAYIPRWSIQTLTFHDRVSCKVVCAGQVGLCRPRMARSSAVSYLILRMVAAIWL